MRSRTPTTTDTSSRTTRRWHRPRSPSVTVGARHLARHPRQTNRAGQGQRPSYRRGPGQAPPRRPGERTTGRGAARRGSAVGDTRWARLGRVESLPGGKPCRTATLSDHSHRWSAKKEPAAAARPAAPGGVRRAGPGFGSAPGVAGGQQAGHLGDRVGGGLEVPADVPAFLCLDLAINISSEALCSPRWVREELRYSSPSTSTNWTRARMAGAATRPKPASGSTYQGDRP